MEFKKYNVIFFYEINNISLNILATSEKNISVAEKPLQGIGIRRL